MVSDGNRFSIGLAETGRIGFLRRSDFMGRSERNKELRRSRRNRQQEQRSPYKQTVFSYPYRFIRLLSVHPPCGPDRRNRRVPAGKPSPAWQPPCRKSPHRRYSNRACADIRHKKNTPSTTAAAAATPQRGRSFRPPAPPAPGSGARFITPHPFRRTDSRTGLHAALAGIPLFGQSVQSAEHRPHITQGCGNLIHVPEIVAQFTLFGFGRQRIEIALQQPLNSFVLLFHRPSFFFSTSLSPLRARERITRTCASSHAAISAISRVGYPSISF